MDGRQVYRRAVTGMVASAQRSMASAGIAAAEVDWLVGHQANARILTAVAGKLGIPAERCASNIDRYGNTSAASIPLVLADLPAAPRDRVLLTAFGAGFTWASAVLAWPEPQRDKERR
jgi:3-oxoacyl-[acyl-carrier-protein] synthase-3